MLRGAMESFILHGESPSIRAFWRFFAVTENMVFESPVGRFTPELFLCAGDLESKVGSPAGRSIVVGGLAHRQID